MKTVPDESWRPLAVLPNADVYEIRDDVIAIVPRQDAVDDEASARASLEFQRSHWKSRGHRGAVVVLMDPMRDQTAGARAAYANEGASTLTSCYALVGETFYAQAVSAVFTGLAKPAVPTNVFRSFDEADVWIREINARRAAVP
jgi:hypothetical protein